MIRSTATKHCGQDTEMTRAGWMTADAWTAIQRRQQVIKQHVPLIASARSSHPFMLKMLRIWRSMVPVFRADREVVKACKEARRVHREALANDLDMALCVGTCETLGKQDCAIGQASAHPSYSRDTADSREPHAKRKKGSPIAFGQGGIHNPPKGGEGPDFLRFVNLLDGVGKMIFGGWLELIEDPYRHWQFGFVRSRGVTDLSGYPLGHLGACCKGRLVPKRTAVGHCQGLRHVGQRAAFPRCDRSKCPLRHRRPTGPLSAGSHAHQKGHLLDSNGVCVREKTWAQASSDEATMLLLKSGMSSWMRDRGLVVLWYDKLQWGCLRLRSTSL